MKNSEKLYDAITELPAELVEQAGKHKFRRRSIKRWGTAIAAVLALCYYYLLPFDLVVRQTLVILAFSPIGSATPVFTKQLGCDAGLSSAINSIAIVISITIIVALLMVM